MIYRKLGGVRDLSRSTRLRLVLLPLSRLLELPRSPRPSLVFVLPLLLSRSWRGDRLRPLRLLPPPNLLRFIGGGVKERSMDRERDRERDNDLSRWGGVFERERLRLLDLRKKISANISSFCAKIFDGKPTLTDKLSCCSFWVGVSRAQSDLATATFLECRP